MKKYIAELIGTFWLVLGGCGSAVLAAVYAANSEDINFFNIGLGFLGVSLAFGLTVVTMAYAIGHISGCHLNIVFSLTNTSGNFESYKLKACGCELSNFQRSYFTLDVIYKSATRV